MLFLETEDFSDFPVRQRRFPFAHFPRNLRIWTSLLQEFFRGHLRGYRIICRIKDLEAQTVFLDAQITDLT